MGWKSRPNRGSTILDVAILRPGDPHLCYMEGAGPLGRLPARASSRSARPQVQAGLLLHLPGRGRLIVHTDTKRVIAARRMMIEPDALDRPHVQGAPGPGSKFRREPSKRFPPRNEEWALLRLCIRMCDQQMTLRAIGFQNRATKGKSPRPSTSSRRSVRSAARACMSVVPAARALRGPIADTDICNACLRRATCLEVYGELTAGWYDAGRCGTCVQETKK